MSASTDKTDSYTEITNKIADALEAGTAPWSRPWDTTGCFDAPMNGASGRKYRGLNVWLLALANMGDPRWFTYKQASERQAQVRKGEKGSKVFFWQFFDKWIDANGVEVRKPTQAQIASGAVRKVDSVPYLRIYTVFNAKQIDGIKPLADIPDVDPAAKYAEAARIAAQFGVTINHGGGEASYSRSTDTIRLPEPGRFTTVEDYWGTVFHEIGHATGHTDRLDRNLSNRFGSDAYAMEELVAELTSAFVCASIGIAGRLQHAEYLGHWAKVLRADRYAIFTAASAAQKAADFILAGGAAVAVTPDVDDSDADDQQAQAAAAK